MERPCHFHNVGKAQSMAQPPSATGSILKTIHFIGTKPQANECGNNHDVALLDFLRTSAFVWDQRRVGVLYGVISNITPWLSLPPRLVVPNMFPCLSTATLP